MAYHDEFEDYRIYKYKGVLIGDNRYNDVVKQMHDVEEAIANGAEVNLADMASLEQFEALVKVTPTDIGLDSDNKLQLLHDGEVITGQVNKISVVTSVNGQTGDVVIDGGSGTQTTFKTLFGNQNITGTGNIDLFCHMIRIKDTAGDAEPDKVDFLITFYSSKNIVVDSLTDLKTLLGDTFEVACNGIDKSGDATKTAYRATQLTVKFTDGTTRTLAGLYFKDDLMTI